MKVRASLLNSKSKEEFDDKFVDKVVKQIQLFDITKEEEEQEEEEEVLPELSQEAEVRIQTLVTITVAVAIW